MSQNKSGKNNIVEFNSHETRIALLEQSTIYLKESIDNLKTEIKEFKNETRAEFKLIKNEFKEIRKEAVNHLKWILGIMLAAFGGLAGLMAHGFHWI